MTTSGAGCENPRPASIAFGARLLNDARFSGLSRDANGVAPASRSTQNFYKFITASRVTVGR
jgi:hypothetical protein